MLAYTAGFSQMSHEELSHVAANVITKSNELVGADPGATPLIETMKEKRDLFETSFSKTPGYAKTALVRNADFIRDNMAESIKYLALAYAHRIDHPDQSDAGQRIVGIIRENGWQLEKGDLNETMQLDSLKIKLETPQAVADLTTCSMKDWVDSVFSSNDSFKKVQSARTDDIVADNSPQLLQCRKELLAALRGLVSYTESMASKQPQTFGALYEYIKQTIKEVRAKTDSRDTRSENASKKDTPTQNPVPQTQV